MIELAVCISLAIASVALAAAGLWWQASGFLAGSVAVFVFGGISSMTGR